MSVPSRGDTGRSGSTLASPIPFGRVLTRRFTHPEGGSISRVSTMVDEAPEEDDVRWRCGIICQEHVNVRVFRRMNNKEA